MKSIIIPAYNEASLLPRTLSALLADDALVNCQLIIVCNGCIDNSMEVVNAYKASIAEDIKAKQITVEVIDEVKASKTHALNVGLSFASNEPVIFLDADILVSGQCLMALFAQLEQRKLKAMSPKVCFDTAKSSLWVRRYYQVEQISHYNQNLRLSNVIALSAEAVKELKQFPDVIADDEYLRRSFNNTDYAILNEFSFSFIAPRNIYSLITVLARVERGNIQLNQMGHVSESTTSGSSKPQKLIARIIFIVTKLCAKVLARFEYYLGRRSKWHRDLSNRC